MERDESSRVKECIHRANGINERLDKIIEDNRDKKWDKKFEGNDFIKNETKHIHEKINELKKMKSFHLYKKKGKEDPFSAYGSGI